MKKPTRRFEAVPVAQVRTKADAVGKEQVQNETKKKKAGRRVVRATRSK